MTHIRSISESADSNGRHLLQPLVLTLLLALGLAGCAPSQGPASLNQPPAVRQDSSSEQPDRPASNFASDPLDGLETALEAQCTLARPPLPWPQLCLEMRSEKAALRAWLERRFELLPLRNAAGEDRGLITGYFEPELNGSLTRETARQVPLLLRPPPGAPALRFTRTQMEAQIHGTSEVLAWIDDPVEAYFLQIQGSGRIRLRDGSVMRVGFAGDNGQPYRAIGRDLIERGVLSTATLSARAIADWLRANPAEGREVMQNNPRYIFFREAAAAPASRGPIGSLGVALTALRSVAVDPRAIALGSLLWLEVADPRGGTLRRLVVAQDTGAAIVGLPRADLYWGTGAGAGEAAGTMKTAGRLWWLRPRP